MRFRENIKCSRCFKWTTCFFDLSTEEKASFICKMCKDVDKKLKQVDEK